MIHRLFSSPEAVSGPWRVIRTADDWQQVLERSAHKPQVLLKHSIRCGTSAMAKYELEGRWPEPPADFDLVYVDVIHDRPLSNRISQDLKLVHHSPQLMVLWNGRLAFQTSHHRITADRLLQALGDLERPV